MENSITINGCFNTLTEPVKTFFVLTDKTLVSGNNYYIILFIKGQMVSMTNKFENVGKKLYEVDFFANQVTIPFCDFTPDIQRMVKIVGMNYRSESDYDIDTFNEICYQMDDSYVSNKDNTIKEYLLQYHDSDFTNYHRQNMQTTITKIYGKNVDNVLRVFNGEIGVAYTIILPFSNVSSITSEIGDTLPSKTDIFVTEFVAEQVF